MSLILPNVIAFFTVYAYVIPEGSIRSLVASWKTSRESWTGRSLQSAAIMPGAAPVMALYRQHQSLVCVSDWRGMFVQAHTQQHQQCSRLSSVHVTDAMRARREWRSQHQYLSTCTRRIISIIL